MVNLRGMHRPLQFGPSQLPMGTQDSLSLQGSKLGPQGRPPRGFAVGMNVVVGFFGTQMPSRLPAPKSRHSWVMGQAGNEGPHGRPPRVLTRPGTHTPGQLGPSQLPIGWQVRPPVQGSLGPQGMPPAEAREAPRRDIMSVLRRMIRAWLGFFVEHCVLFV